MNLEDRFVMLGAFIQSFGRIFTSETGYQAMIEMRAPKVGTRIGSALLIAGFTAAISHASWVAVWFGVVLVGQVSEHLFDRRFLAKPRRLSGRDITAICFFVGFNSAVYAGIAPYLWFRCGYYGPPCAELIICGLLLHICLHLQAVRPVMVISLLCQIPFVFSLPILSGFGSGPSIAVSMLFLVLGWCVYLSHLTTVTTQHDDASRALAAAKAVAEDQRRRAEAANHTKSAFLAAMSHEIRTPLNAITSAAHLLDKAQLSGAEREYVSILTTGSQVLLRLVNDILDLSKIEAGKFTLNIAEVHLGRTAQNLEALWRLNAQERGLAFEVRLDPAAPTVILSDGLRLDQILFNLVSNAVKFTAQGGVRIEIGQTLSDDPNAGQLWVQVSDTGPGMSEEVLGRLFQNFEQADAGVAVKFGGTGLGLAISHKLACLLGGALSVDSAVGVGSTFRLTLPLRPAASEPDAPVIDADADFAEPAAGERCLSILLAEDHAVNRRLVELLLAPMGWRLTFAEDGGEAVALAEAQPFDIILMDMQMPILSGLEATRRIVCGDGPNRMTPIIALTANAFAEQAQAWTEAGAQGFLTKPIHPAALIATIARLADPASVELPVRVTG